jgi:hypothetical protein
MKHMSNAMRMSQRMTINVFHPVGAIAPVDIPARRVASNATRAKVQRSYSKTTVYAPNAAAGTTRPVNIAALKVAMAMHLVSHARSDAKCAVFTHGAINLVVNHVLPVPRQRVVQAVSILSVLHPVPPLATGCPAP